MAKYRVKAGAKASSDDYGTPKAGVVLDWDGHTDGEGDIYIPPSVRGDGGCYVHKDYVEPVEAPKAEVIEETREIVQKVTEKTVVLRLTEAEAQLIADVFYRVGGGRFEARAAIIRALESAGFDPDDDSTGTVWASPTD